LYISFAGRIRKVVCLFPFNFLLSKLINQFESIMQNKPNFPAAQMNVTPFYTVDYENNSNWKLGENKPNTNPIKAKTSPISNLYLARPSAIYPFSLFTFPFRLGASPDPIDRLMPKFLIFYTPKIV
ncbi:MAG: hypothetical protein JSV99_06905, partial [Planctomycetota bacterium]